MFFRILIVIILLIIGHKVLVAQNRPTDDTPKEPSTRKTSHYIGLQANQLIRQLISFGGNASPITNPYSLVYSVNSNTNGFGFATGLGFSSIESRTTDNFNNIITKTNNFAWRFGLEKKKYLSKHWLISLGGDILVEATKTETSSSFSGPGGGSTSKITTKENRAGFGPRASLSYQFHNHILIGTEASYYFKWINQEQEATGAGGQPQPPKTKLKQHNFTLPAVVFLMVKF